MHVAMTPFAAVDSMQSVSPVTIVAVASSANPAQASTTSSPSRYAATCKPTSGPALTSDWRTAETESAGSISLGTLLDPRVGVREGLMQRITDVVNRGARSKA